MANQTLAEFTEKLFVADADHTFIWDTAASISKRVSRNSWLNSGTLTSDAPVTISQTWNNAAVAFTGLKVNAAGTSGTNSAAASLLADFQVGGVSQFNISKIGMVDLAQSQTSGGLNFTGGYYGVMTAFNWQLRNPNGYIGLGATSVEADTRLYRDGLNTLALRNSTNAQTFNVYGTYTSGTSYERLTLSAPSAANAIIGTNKGSGGGTARGLEFQTDGVARLRIAAGGAFDFLASITSTSSISASASDYIMWGGGASSRMSAPSNGIIQFTNAATTGFDRLQFGSTTDAFPAIARDGAGIKFTGAAAGSTSWIKVPPVAVGSLPVAATAGAGARAFVNDASAPVFGTAVAGGGAVLVLVYCTGSAWNVG
jgi:hypothetical protein